MDLSECQTPPEPAHRAGLDGGNRGEFTFVSMRWNNLKSIRVLCVLKITYSLTL